MALDVLIRNTSEVITAQGTESEDAEKALAPIRSGAVGIEGGLIQYLGPEIGLPRSSIDGSTTIVDAEGGFVGPGFVDPHTHLVFAGDRADEFELRCRGASYAEIAARGGGIAQTVASTRAASKEELIQLALPRLLRLLEHGVTQAEVKSGYGLTLEDELKMLEVIAELNERQRVTLHPTLLCAHAIPPEFRHARQKYVDLCIAEIIPVVAKAKLARYFDVFVETSAFTSDEARSMSKVAQAHGFQLRLHADQLSAQGGAQLAAELGALSADHLEHVSDEGIAALAKARVSAVLMPTTTLFIREKKYAPGRKLRDARVNVAVATNINPGSSMSENTALALGLSCLSNDLTPAEAYWGATRGAAIALGLPDVGRLRVGGPADIVVFTCSSYRHLPYHLGINQVTLVLKAGELTLTRAG